QIIGNLLNNAAKYTDPGGHIEIRGERRGALVAIEIKDNGIGIPPEQVPNLFDLFTQGSRGVDRSQGGLGIGLTLVRSLTELHGGRVEAASAGLGKGSSFTILLPGPSEVARPPGEDPPSISSTLDGNVADDAPMTQGPTPSRSQ